MGRWADDLSTWFGALGRPARAGELVLAGEGGVPLVRRLGLAVAALYSFYGLSMGLYHGALPGVISALKLPFL